MSNPNLKEENENNPSFPIETEHRIYKGFSKKEYVTLQILLLYINTSTLSLSSIEKKVNEYVDLYFKLIEKK